MCPRGLLAVFLISIAFGRCLGKKVAVISIMTDIRMEPDCKMIDPYSVKMLESAYWMIDKVQRFSKNVTYKIEVRDICGKFSAVPATLDLLNKYHNGSDKLIGIVTASTSRKAIMISNTITSLPAEYHVIQIGTRETVPELSNPDKYKNVFTVLPDDRTQFQMICDVLVEFNWNYIALLYQDDVYGIEGAELLSQCAKKARIHIVVKLVINLSNLDILKFDYQKVSGSVIIAQDVTVKRFFEKDRFGRKMSFIMTEAVSIEGDLFRLHSNGAFIIVQTAFFGSQKFEKYWENLFNDTIFQNTVLKNPYFTQMIEELTKCSSSCNVENAKELVASKMPKLRTTETIQTALYALTSVLGQILETPCLVPNKCLPFYKEASKALHKENSYAFLKNQLGYERMGISAAFDANRTLAYPPNWIFYQLYYRKKNEFTDTFFFEKAGRYSSSGLTLNTDAIPGYDNSGNEFPVPSVTCERKRYCKEHVKDPGYIYKDGDIIFVGIVPIHNKQPSDLSKCGSTRMVSGVSLAEAMLFGIEKLNERRVYTNIFPGKKVAQWSKTRGITFNKNVQPPSWTTKCPNRKHCSECIQPNVDPLITNGSTKKHKSYAGVLAAFVIFSVCLIVLIFIVYKFHRPIRNPRGVRHQPEGENPDPYDGIGAPFQMVTIDDESTTVKEVE